MRHKSRYLSCNVCFKYLTFESNFNMIDIHPQFLTDTAGQKLVVLSQQEFDSIIEELEELEDIRLFDQAKREDDGTRILFSDYLKNRESNNG